MITKSQLLKYKNLHRTLIHSSDYLYLRPHPSISKYISSYAITYPSPAIMSDAYTIMPDGCGRLVAEVHPNRFANYLFGPLSQAVTVGYNPATFLVIVEFQPAGLYALTAIDQNELTNQVYLLSDINKQLHNNLIQCIEKATNVHHLVTALDNLLYTQLQTQYNPHITAAFGHIFTHKGNIATKQLAQATHYSERQLNRIFNATVGITAKPFAKLVRLNNAHQLIERTNLPIHTIAENTGYHDLSHFIHDFKDLSGITPQAYRNNMSDFYSAINKF